MTKNTVLSLFQYECGLTKTEETEELQRTITEQQQMLANIKMKYQRLEKDKTQMEARYKKQIEEYKAQVGSLLRSSLERGILYKKSKLKNIKDISSHVVAVLQYPQG